MVINLFPKILKYKNYISHLKNSSKTFCTKGNHKDKIISIKNLKLTLTQQMGVDIGYSPVKKDRSNLLKYLPKSQDELPKRSMQDSFIEGLLPLSTDKKLQDKYVSFLGRVRLGRLLEDMDIFAVMVAYKHILNPKAEADVPFPYTIVTALVDTIVFTDYLPKPQEDIKLSGHVSWVGKSSLEVVVWLEQKSENAWHRITKALFVLAARNSTNTKSAVINELVPANDKEKEIFSGGEGRKKRRVELQKGNVLKVMPTEQEQQVIYDMYLRSAIMEGRQRRLPPGSIWMAQCTLSNIVFSHPEDRNIHNTVFGGFIMRHAVELTWVLGYRFSKHRPKLIGISDIHFVKPITVNSLIEMHGHIVYTYMNYIQIIAFVEVYSPDSGERTTTNIFHFTYRTPELLKEVIPHTYDEAMMYINGKRHFEDILTVIGDKKG